MVRVTFTPHLQRHLDCPSARVAGSTVREALEAVFARRPGTRTYLLDDQGALRPHLRVLVNGEPVQDRERLADPVGPDAELYVLQALSGG